jgi:signal transduction histidine kinase
MKVVNDPTKMRWFLVLIIFYFSLAIGLAGYAFFLNQKRSIKEERWRGLDAILSLKIKQITDWRDERKTDGAAIVDNPFIAPLFQQFLQSPNTTRSRKDILDWMKSLQRPQQNQGYESVVLLDSKMAVRLSVPQGKTLLAPFLKKGALEAAQKKKVTLSDFYRDESSNSIRLNLFVPIITQKGSNTLTVGVVLLEINPNQFLYPLIQTWPTPSDTSETLLVHREGKDILFLNELRHRKKTALVLHLPIEHSQILAAMAARGESGLVEGLDYRGVPVLGAIGKIPDSPWFLVAKVDQQEIYAPIRLQAYMTAVLAGTLVTMVAFGVGFLWRGYHLEEHRLFVKEIKKLNEDLTRRASELERANKELETFSYSVSHDLRNPLIGIKGLSHMVLEKYPSHLDDKALQLLSLIEKKSKSMLQLIDDLMSFFGFQHQEVKSSPIDMAEIVGTVFDELKTVMPVEGLKVDVEPLCSSCGDRAMIRQVFHNLLSNAIKFTRPKENGMIEIGCKTGDSENIFYVKDNGIGFDMQHAAKLFNVFQRLHPADKFEGTGIGLATVQRIVERHGGRVWAEGRVDKGATFYFTLPRRENC